MTLKTDKFRFVTILTSTINFMTRDDLTYLYEVLDSVDTFWNWKIVLHRRAHEMIQQAGFMSFIAEYFQILIKAFIT